MTLRTVRSGGWSRQELGRRWSPATWGLVAALVVYGNLVSFFVPEDFTAPVGPKLPLNLGMLTFLAAWGLWWQRLSLASLGFQRRGAPTAAIVGVALGCLLALPAVVYLVLPFRSPAPNGFEEVAVGALLVRVLVAVPLGTALFEEVAFRGLLHASLERDHSPRTAAVLGSAVFALWHLVISFRTVLDSVGHPALLGLGYALSLLGVFIGGLFFTWLRLRSGHLAASIGCHWAVVAVMSSVLVLSR